MTEWPRDVGQQVAWFATDTREWVVVECIADGQVAADSGVTEADARAKLDARREDFPRLAEAWRRHVAQNA